MHTQAIGPGENGIIAKPIPIAENKVDLISKLHLISMNLNINVMYAMKINPSLVEEV